MSPDASLIDTLPKTRDQRARFIRLGAILPNPVAAGDGMVPIRQSFACAKVQIDTSIPPERCPEFLVAKARCWLSVDHQACSRAHSSSSPAAATKLLNPERALDQMFA